MPDGRKSGCCATCRRRAWWSPGWTAGRASARPWGRLARRAPTRLRGEFVFITGPSRTADIEKILILGAHGPKRLVVLLVG